jgi:DNA-binding LacI/PurR family transcriptional regulator/DNA-binding transcriptional ArsR family regulator
MKKKKILEYPTKHGQLTAILRESLRKEKFQGNKFFTVRKLMDDFKVSQATVSKALAPLFAEGLIYSVSGKGIFVLPAGSKDGERKTSSFPTVNYIISDSEMFSPASNPTDWFICKDIMEGVTSSAFELGYRVNIVPVNSDSIDLRQFDETIKSSGSESLFVFYNYGSYEALIQACIENGAPFSVYTWDAPVKRKINQVWVDMEEGAFRNAKRLISLGHENIAFLGGSKKSTRYKGHLKALREAGVKGAKKYDLLPVYGSIESAAEAVHGLLDKYPEITAISCFSDLRALGAIKAAKERGLDVPRDLSVLGVDDISSLYPSNPILSTMRFPGKDVGKELVKLADADLKKRKTSRSVRLVMEMVKGASCSRKS